MRGRDDRCAAVSGGNQRAAPSAFVLDPKIGAKPTFDAIYEARRTGARAVGAFLAIPTEQEGSAYQRAAAPGPTFCLPGQTLIGHDWRAVPGAEVAHRIEPGVAGELHQPAAGLAEAVPSPTRSPNAAGMIRRMPGSRTMPRAAWSTQSSDRVTWPTRGADRASVGSSAAAG